MLNLEKLIPQPPWGGVPLPSGVRLTWKQVLSTVGTWRKDIRDRFLLGGTPKLLNDLFYLIYTSISRAALAEITRDPSKVQRWVSEIEAQVSTRGKLTQSEVVYIDISPPPFFWDYKCLKCRWWGPTVGLGDQTCKVVEGVISSQGWCAIWVPPHGYKAFTWPKELLGGKW